MMKLEKKWFIGGGIVLLLALPFFAKTIRTQDSLQVDIVLAREHSIRPSILSSGLLAYSEEVNLTSEVLAKVTDILVREGDRVEKGQVLLQLDPETYRNAIEREDATRRQMVISIERQRLALDLKQKQFMRSQQLLDQRMIDQAHFDQDRNQLELAKIELRSSEESLRRAEAVLRDAHELLDRTEIRSPITGTIVAIPIKVGETAIPSTSALMGAQLMKIADTSALQAELKVDEADVAKVSLGQHVDLYPAAYPDTGIKGEVTQIALAPTVEPGNQGRAYKVTAILNAPTGMSLRSGMSARADIFLGDGGEVLAVPVEAILSEDGERGETVRYVWKLVDGQAHKSVIEAGLSDDRWEEVLTGLTQGERIITGPANLLRRLREGDRLRGVEKKIDSHDKKDKSDQSSEQNGDADANT